MHAHPARLELIPLGGLGEFGMNLMVVRHGTECIVLDAGMMFPGAEHLGVDVVIPNLSFLEDCGTIHGVVLTHGHEDHIGALPWVLADHDVPVFCSPYTAGLIRSRLDEHELIGRRRVNTVPPDGGELRLGPFTIETLAVAHSIPQSMMLVVRTPAGTLFHTADFKLDPHPPDGVTADLRRLARLGDEGILVLLSDSTNSDCPGFTPGERTVRAALDAQIGSAPGRVLLTTFSSNIYRLQQAVDLAARHGRRVALVGSSIQNQVAVAQRLGLFSMPPEVGIPADRVMDLPPERAMLLVTGSQGEPMSALARIAVDKHRDVSITDGDRVLHSARRIPGNDKSIGRMVNHLMRRGAEVVTESDARIHVSGHPSREELRLMLQLLRPRFFIPVHGEYRQLHAHAGLAREVGLDPSAIVLADSGDLIAVGEKECGVRERVPVGRVFIDAGLDEVDFEILRDRRRIAADGVVVPVVAIDRESGALGGPPEIVTRGFVPEEADDGLMREARRVVAELLAESTPEERSDEGVVKARIQTELKRFIRRRTQRRPLIVPVIVEF